MLENLFNFVKQQAGDAIVIGQANASAPVAQPAAGNFLERLHFYTHT